MPAPTRVDWTSGSNAGAATLTLTNPAGATTGDRVYAFVSHTGTAATITDLQGWSLVLTLTFNTRKLEILERAYAATYPALTLSTAEGMLWATAAVRATSGYDLGATSVGTSWRRVDNGGSINTTQAPSMTAPADALALAFFSETSTAAEVEANTTLSGTGWSKWFWSKATAGDANPINFVAYATPAAGATGTATTTWLNNSNNGAGVQLLIPQTPNTSTSVGVAASTLPAMTQAAAGATTVPAFTGSAASVLPPMSSAASGTTTPPVFTGSATSTLPPMTQAATATSAPPVFTGTAASVLPAIGSQAVGTTEPPHVTGTAASVLPAMTTSAEGTVTEPVVITGEIASTLPAMVSSATGTFVDVVDRPPFPDTLTLTGSVDGLTLAGSVPVLTLEVR